MAQLGYRRLTNDELIARGFSPKSERYIGPLGILSRRGYDVLRREPSRQASRAPKPTVRHGPALCICGCGEEVSKGRSDRRYANGSTCRERALRARRKAVSQKG